MKLRFWYQVIATSFSRLCTKSEILIRYRNEKNVLWHCWLGHISLTRKIVSEMTYIVSSGTLNPTIPIPIARAFSRLCTKSEILIRYRNEKNDYWSISSNLCVCTKALCPSTYCAEVLSLAVELIPGPSFTSLWQSSVEYLLPRKFMFCLHYWSYREFVSNSYSRCRCQLHKYGHTTFVSLWFTWKQVFWTWYLCAVNRRYVDCCRLRFSRHLFVCTTQV